jgi:hypothetical protein
MPSLSDVLAFREEMFKRSFELVRQKGADYNRDQQQEGDTLFNLKVCELLGVVETTEQGILVRLSDKFMRLISLTKTAGREPSVKNESVLDTVADVHNYVDYLALKYLERQRGGIIATVAESRANYIHRAEEETRQWEASKAKAQILSKGGPVQDNRENYALHKEIVRDIQKDPYHG